MASEAVKKTSQEKGEAPPKPEAGECVASSCAEEEAEGKGAAQATAKPAHHARRPMNAFLIFCKRHRTVVRKCYPNLENRAITKILGDWWSQLDNTEKESYIQLAQQYKEAFLKAFPDFKWYKLPAPPLRTLVTRPSNHSKPHKLECHLTCGPIVPGKLADESQMGRLSTLILSSAASTTTTASQSVAGSLPTSPTTCCMTSLLTTVPTPTSPRTPTASAAPTCLALPTVPKPPKKRYLQGLFDTTCAGDQTPPDPGMDAQELFSPVEKHVSEWNEQQFTFGEPPPSMMSSHCPDFTTLPLATLHSPRNDACDHKLYTAQSALCGDSAPASSEGTLWSSNTDRAATRPELGDAGDVAVTPYSSETTFHTSKQVIIDFVVDKLVNEPCFQVRPGFVSSPNGADAVISESFTGASNQDSRAGSFPSSDVQRCSMANVLQFASTPTSISLPPLRGVTGSFVPPHTTTRRDCLVNSFCSQPVSYVTASSSGTEIVTWAQDISVSRIVASLNNNNVYINKGKNGTLEVENLNNSPSSDCGLADCIPNNASDRPFPLKSPETVETNNGPFLINCKVYDAAYLKSGCEKALISLTGYSSEECTVTSGCDVSKTISYLPFSNEPKLPQSDLSVKFSLNSLEVNTCVDDQDPKNLSVPAKIMHLDKAASCPVKSGDDDGKNVTVAGADTCTSSSHDARQVQSSTATSYARECSSEDRTFKAKSPTTNDSSVVKMFSLKEHLKRYKAEKDCGDAPPDDDSRRASAVIVDPTPHHCLLPALDASTKPSSRQAATHFHSAAEHTSRVVDQMSTSPASRVKTSAAVSASGENVVAYSFKSSPAGTFPKKSEDFGSAAVKPPLLPQRQTSVRACKGQRYKQFMKETNRGGNKRARKTVLNNGEGVGTATPKKEFHQQISSDSVAGFSADSCRLPDMSPVLPPEAGVDELLPASGPPNADVQAGMSSWYVASSQLPLQPVVSPRRERLDSASSCCSSERTFSACSEGSLDALSSVFQTTCSVTNPSMAPNRTSVANCSHFGGSVSPTEKRKRKFSESLFQQDMITDGAGKKNCETFDFNLDEKIGALPPLSLEDFQIKKKNRKKRCFPILKTSTVTSGTAPEAATSHSTTYTATTAASDTTSVTWEATTLVPDSVPEGRTLPKHSEDADLTAAEDLVGSQKRKARRNSIRRLDTDRIEADRVGADLWIGLLLLADAATSRSKIVVPSCSQETDAAVVSHAHTSLS